MSTRLFVGISILSSGYALSLIFRSPQFSIPNLVIVFFVRGFLADLLSACVHFCFDYVFPEDLPVLGAVSQAFRRHHDHPVLDPSSLLENFSMGATATLPLSLAGMLLLWSGESEAAFLAGAVVAAMSIWGLFFHQIHAYAHMGAHIDVEDMNRRIAKILSTGHRADQVRQLTQICDGMPIPRPIRLLQRYRLLLDPVITSFTTPKRNAIFRV